MHFYCAKIDPLLSHTTLTDIWTDFHQAVNGGRGGGSDAYLR